MGNKNIKGRKREKKRKEKKAKQRLTSAMTLEFYTLSMS